MLVDDPVAAVDAVAAGRVDAALVDLSTALVLTKGRSDVTTGGRFVTEARWPSPCLASSANVEVVDAACTPSTPTARCATSRERYLDPAFAKDPASVPVIRTPDQ